MVAAGGRGCGSGCGSGTHNDVMYLLYADSGGQTTAMLCSNCAWKIRDRKLTNTMLFRYVERALSFGFHLLLPTHHICSATLTLVLAPSTEGTLPRTGKPRDVHTEKHDFGACTY